jgi:hypothetical protein
LQQHDPEGVAAAHIDPSKAHCLHTETQNKPAAHHGSASLQSLQQYSFQQPHFMPLPAVQGNHPLVRDPEGNAGLPQQVSMVENVGQVSILESMLFSDEQDRGCTASQYSRLRTAIKALLVDPKFQGMDKSAWCTSDSCVYPNLNW